MRTVLVVNIIVTKKEIELNEHFTFSSFIIYSIFSFIERLFLARCFQTRLLQIKKVKNFPYAAEFEAYAADNVRKHFGVWRKCS